MWLQEVYRVRPTHQGGDLPGECPGAPLVSAGAAHEVGSLGRLVPGPAQPGGIYTQTPRAADPARNGIPTMNLGLHRLSNSEPNSPLPATRNFPTLTPIPLYLPPKPGKRSRVQGSLRS